MRTRLVGLICPLALLGCAGTDPCCLAAPRAELVGMVTTATGAPVSGATIRAYTGRPACPGVDPWPDNGAIGTSVAGEYALSGYGGPADRTYCLRVVARLATGTDSAVVEQVVMDSAANQPSRFRVNLALP